MKNLQETKDWLKDKQFSVDGLIKYDSDGEYVIDVHLLASLMTTYTNLNLHKKELELANTIGGFCGYLKALNWYDIQGEPKRIIEEKIAELENTYSNE